jgi:hypothetical protein
LISKEDNMAKEKCKCRPAIGVLGVILLTLGIYFLVWGFSIQTTGNISWSNWNWSALLSYLIGIILLGFGIIAKHKGYEECKLHS